MLAASAQWIVIVAVIVAMITGVAPTHTVTADCYATVAATEYIPQQPCFFIDPARTPLRVVPTGSPCSFEEVVIYEARSLIAIHCSRTRQQRLGEVGVVVHREVRLERKSFPVLAVNVNESPAILELPVREREQPMAEQIQRESDKPCQDRTTIIACVVGSSITLLGFVAKKSVNA
jgi:hypothetical protein